MPDAIDQAIANTVGRPPAPQIPFQITLGTDRKVMLVAPADLTDTEALEVVAQITTQLHAIWAQNRAQAAAPSAGRLFVPGRTPVREVVAK